ncbi:MAG: clostripain [Bacteroides sp.]|nr:clostripain [Bacteroides sp.]
MKKWFVILLTPLIFTACDGKDDIPTPSQPEKEQASITVWSYLVADTNIKTDLRNNIKTMYEGLSQLDKKATLLIYWDGGNSDIYLKSSPCILKYETDGYGNINGIAARDSSYSLRTIAEYGEIVKEYDMQLSTNKDVMTSILKDMKSFSPQSKIVMSAGSHGSAWINTITARSARSFGQDGERTNNTITTSDMAKAITNAGIKLELLLFDACMMGTAEVCYDFKDATNYLITSPLDVPAPGFPYNYLLDNLYEGTISGYTEACKAYVDYYATYPGGWASIALYDCKQIEALAAEVKQQLNGKKDALYEYNPVSKGLQHYGLNPGATDFKFISFDMKQFMEDLNDGVVPTNIQNQLTKTVLYADCLENTEHYTIEKVHYCGMGMYIPIKEREHWNTYFKTISWYKAAGWDNVSFSWGF